MPANQRPLFLISGTALILLLLLLSGCGSTSMNKSHPIYVTDKDVAAANVWFIRPFTYRERGLADNPVQINVNEELLLKLGKGEYTFARLRAGKLVITTSNLSEFTHKQDPVTMTRTAEMTVEPGKNYFLHIRQVNEEFRGVYYLTEQVDLDSAKQLADPLSADGVPGDFKLHKL